MNKRRPVVDRFRLILYLSALVVFVFYLVAFNATATLARNPRTLFIHPSSLILHPLQQPLRKINPETLKKYVGRYALDAGIIPISTLDVTFENNGLWVKPSVVKKRRLLHKSGRVSLDEIEGTAVSFNKDDEGRIVSLTFV